MWNEWNIGERVMKKQNAESKSNQDFEKQANDWIISQDWEKYTEQEHTVWKTLYQRQLKTLKGLVCDEFYQGVELINLGSEKIPDIRRINEKLYKLTGWTVVTVPSLVPDDVFFHHLSNRRFPAGQFIRKSEQIDYLQEPDIFHDIFGHIPLLTLPVFADYMEAYGHGGLRALNAYDQLKNLARLYWYTVEFGLINKPEGLWIYGAGIISSNTESVFSIQDASPNRVHFDLKRIMSTDYKIDDFQQTYFVIHSFDELFEKTQQDFADIYPKLEVQAMYCPEDIAPKDKIYHQGTQHYAHSVKEA